MFPKSLPHVAVGSHEFRPWHGECLPFSLRGDVIIFVDHWCVEFWLELSNVCCLGGLRLDNVESAGED